jgi:hypothetical protein
MEYYQTVFQHLYATLSHDIRSAYLSEPKQILSGILKDTPNGTVLSNDHGWEVLREALNRLELELKNISERNSSQFWIHLYRRIDVNPYSPDGSEITPMTLLWVRILVEGSIFKFSKEHVSPEFSESNRVTENQLMGGLYRKAKKKLVSIANPSEKQEIRKVLNETTTHLLASRQVVLVKFTQQDFIDIHRMEGIAYEYWRLTAQLRALGKGSQYIKRLGLVSLFRETEEQSFLISNYDHRISSTSLFSTPDGQIVLDTRMKDKEDVFFMSPNVNAISSDNLAGLGLSSIKTFTPNFLPAVINLREFSDAHAYTKKLFYEKNGFQLDSLLRYLICINHIYYLKNLAPIDLSQATFSFNQGEVLNFLQRGYKLIGRTQQDINNEVMGYSSHKANYVEIGLHESLENEVLLVQEFLFLTYKNRDQIVLWSGGPRFHFIPLSGGFLLDFSALPYLLRGIFSGLKTGNEGRGDAFEDQFRKMLENNEYKPHAQTEFKNINGDKRQIDAFVEIDNVGYLFECKSMFRPFVYELTKISSQNKRNAEFEKKLIQSESAKEFFTKNPKGKNYDLTHLKRIEHFVVSAFEEWIWSKEERYWYTEETPRILSADEAMNLLRSKTPSPTSRVDN